MISNALILSSIILSVLNHFLCLSYLPKIKFSSYSYSYAFRDVYNQNFHYLRNLKCLLLSTEITIYLTWIMFFILCLQRENGIPKRDGAIWWEGCGFCLLWEPVLQGGQSVHWQGNQAPVSLEWEPVDSDTGKNMLKSTFQIRRFCVSNPCPTRVCSFRNDYAKSIVLLDQRYLRPSSAQALPEWISRHLRTCDKFPAAFQHVRSFFLAQRKSDVAQWGQWTVPFRTLLIWFP